MIETLVAYSQGKANVNQVLRALVSHRGWFAPLGLFAIKAESTRRVKSMITGTENLVPAGELWIFTDADSVNLAIANGASLGAYAGVMDGTELFTIIDPAFHTVYINPCSPPERTWLFREGSASNVARLWAEAIALEETFVEWEQTGNPDMETLMNYRALILYDHASGPVVTLPNQLGLTNPAAAFTAIDCAETFLNELGEDPANFKQVVIDGRRLFANFPLGVDGMVFNFFGPGPTYALRVNLAS